jgi:MFS family permease
MMVGTLLSVLGMTVSSISTEYYQIFLAQGLCVGIGGACIFLPSVAIVATYFTTKRALATGLVTSGGSIIAFIMLGTLTFNIALMKTRIDPGKQARAMLDLKAFRLAPYTIFNIGSFLSFLGLYVSIFYIIIYAQNSANVDTDTSFYLLSILNAASNLERIFPGMLADKLGLL